MNLMPPTLVHQEKNVPSGVSSQRLRQSDQDGSPDLTAGEALIHSFTNPPGKVYLLHGDSAVFTLSLTMASAAIARGTSIAVVDGGNRFDVHLIARFAREHKINPATLLNRIFISRGFTCYQMEQAVTNRLPAFLRSRGASTAMIFNLLETFYDEQAPLREVQHILTRVLQSLEQMKRDGISVLLACPDRTVSPEERNRLLPTLASQMDRVYRLNHDDQDHYRLTQEQHHPSPLIHHPMLQGGPHGPNRTNLYQHHRR